MCARRPSYRELVGTTSKESIHMVQGLLLGFRGLRRRRERRRREMLGGYLRVMVRVGSFEIESSSGLDERTRCFPAQCAVQTVPDGRPSPPALPMPSYPPPPLPPRPFSPSLSRKMDDDADLARETKADGPAHGRSPLFVLLRLIDWRWCW